MASGQTQAAKLPVPAWAATAYTAKLPSRRMSLDDHMHARREEGEGFVECGRGSKGWC